MSSYVNVSTGLPGLDKALKGIVPGDNIVWQVDSINDYHPFVDAFCEFARRHHKKLVYFRFAKHNPLVGDDSYAEIYNVNPEAGFESFLAQIHNVIEKYGYGAFYVFDCLSELIVDWYSDQMLGNFFRLTCPYLYQLKTIAYFALLKDRHSFHAVNPIMETTQLFLNVHQHNRKLYIHPLKVQQRYSPTIHTLHEWSGDNFTPVTQSAIISEVMTSGPLSRVESATQNLGFWSSTFQNAEEILLQIRSGKVDAEKGKEIFEQLLRMAITRNEKLLELARKYLTLEDVINVRKRMIGTGLIGGKSVGFLVARAIMKKHDRRWVDLLEAHDSFFIGSDVFYTFLVENGCWWAHQKQKNPATLYEGAEEARQRMLTGTFPEYIMEQFADILDYFGQSPIIVRSSSLQEDNYGNSFVGKYESVFCANQGPRQMRLEAFLSAVRTVYASAMSEKALAYRARRGILNLDEQMALLVQRVSGDQYGSFYYPQIAGVALSFNPYVWSEYIDPQAGMIRLVFGLGTRAVDRTEDDYTRIVALNDPTRRPETNFDDVIQHTQRQADVIDLDSNRLVSHDFNVIASGSSNLPSGIFVSEPRNMLTFEHLLTKTSFVSDIREMLDVLQKAYDYHVDVEITANFFSNGSYKINLLQCRPLHVREGGSIAEIPDNIAENDVILEAHGAVIGFNRSIIIDQLIYIVPDAYGKLPVKERYIIANLIGKIINRQNNDKDKSIMLLGPGRWGTATPFLGVPVTFGHINKVCVLCEIVAMHEGLVPDVSLGTHFFNELVESDILYLALFPGQKGNFISKDFFDNSKNKLAEILPEEKKWENVVRVIEPADFLNGTTINLNANTFKQRVVCYIQGNAKSDC